MNGATMQARFRPFHLLAAAVVAAAIAGCGSSGGNATTTSASSASRTTAPGAGGKSAATLAPIHGAYSPRIEPADFVRTIDNPFWPLRPGTGWLMKGVRGRTPQTDYQVVTNRTKRILGIPATVVKDTVSDPSGPVERTFDYYAQDKQGNVWYMGELSLEKKNGRFAKASDSWLGGVNGGQPGIIMPADPRPGEKYRQEYYPPGQALDEATVLSRNGTDKVPFGSYKHVLATSEYSPLEPQTEQKYYAAGIGELSEKVVKGHHEAFKLVRMTR